MSEPVSPDHDEPVHSDPAPAHSPVEAVYDGTTLRLSTGESVDLTPAQMKAIGRAYGTWSLALRKAWEAEQRAAGLVWVAQFWIHRSRYTEEFFSEQKAREFLVYGWEEGSLAPDDESILCPDGTVIPRGELDRDMMDE